jgi:murein DD-endopeptidase MepM/ murein hydrolase activator NlpD
LKERLPSFLGRQVCRGSLLVGFCLVLAVLLLQACAHRKVVFEKTRSPQEKKLKQKGVYHVVERHQTLYRICKTYGADIREVASANGVTDYGRIQAGQRIFIPGASRVLKVEVVLDDVVEERDEGEVRKGASLRIPLSWPVRGTCVDFFEGEENRKHQGIDIASPLGTPIKAAGGGKVIYSGNTIRGYGNLIILRHSEDTVTVYAHNQVNLVEEGTMVEKGQIIGKVGQTGNASGPHLHFEVRRGNRAVDPLPFLK